MYFHINTKNQTPGPYEKVLEQGWDSLTDAELIAIILRTGTKGEDTVSIAGKILELSGGISGGLLGLHHLSIEELMSVKGIGRVKAIKLKCVAELSSRIAASRARAVLQADRPQTVAQYYMETLRHMEQEHLILLMMDVRNHLIADMVLGKGTVSSSPLSPREVVVNAYRHKAVNVMLVHNHPGGDPSPSPADIEATKRVDKVCALADLGLVDHLIIGNGGYYSFRENGLL